MSRETHVRFCERPGVRFPRATHLVVVFEHETDAQRVLEVLTKRLLRYGLTIHPEKTRIVPFRRPRRTARRIETDSETFDFLGFTHYWGKSRKGNWVVKQRTASKRFSQKVRIVKQWCRENRHLKVRDQHEALRAKLCGHYNYYGVTGNFEALARFRDTVQRTWHKWLNRRAQRRGCTWERFNRILDHYPLLHARITHSYVT